jgi:hypothetical protein
VFQNADYFAFDPQHAAHYGPEITEHDVSLANPRMITSDADWHALAAEAGVRPSLNMGAMDQRAIRQAADAMAAHLQGKGHDGLVIRNAERTKWPGRIFGHDQVIQFRPAEQSNPKPLADLEGFRSRRQAQQFLDAEVGAPGAKVSRRTKVWGIDVPSEQPSTALTRPQAQPPGTGAKSLPANHVIAEVRDMEGKLLGYEHEPHDGTEDGIRAANTTLRDRLEDIHPTWSNIATRTGATNQHGHPAWAVSPNSRNVYPTGSVEAQDLLNWTSRPTPEKITGPQ